MNNSIRNKKSGQVIFNDKGIYTKCSFGFFDIPATEKLYLQCSVMTTVRVEFSDLTDEEKRKIICLN